MTQCFVFKVMFCVILGGKHPWKCIFTSALYQSSFGPYYIKQKQLSLSVFILACVFPVPAVVYFTTVKFLKYKDSKHTDVETLRQEKEFTYTKSEEVVTE